MQHVNIKRQYELVKDCENSRKLAPWLQMLLAVVYDKKFSEVSPLEYILSLLDCPQLCMRECAVCLSECGGGAHGMPLLE